MTPLIRKNMPELDTLRGLAIAMVVLYHGLAWSLPAQLTPSAQLLSTPFRIGWSGVQLFFVLSGFLITGNLFDSTDRPRRFARFYYRRALRILPAFLLVLAAVAALGMVTWKFALLSLAFFANLAPLAGIANGYPVLWSLAVEEHFYAVWPAVVYNVKLRTVALISAAIVVAEPLARGVSAAHGAGEGLSSFTWYTIDGLATGALLACAARTLSRRTITRAAIAAAAVALLGFAALATTHTWSRTTVIGAALVPTLLHTFFAAALAISLLLGTSAFRRLVHVRWLQWLGYVSYGLYLIHLGCFVIFDRFVAAPRVAGIPFLLTRFAIAVSAAVALAAISRYAFENRFLAMKERDGNAAAPLLQTAASDA